MRIVELAGLALWSARGGGGMRVRRLGAPLLKAPAHLKLQIEHNLSDSHNVPDTTVQGTLATLQCALDPSQYRLLRGMLAHNLGECVDDLLPPPDEQPSAPHSEQVGGRGDGDALPPISLKAALQIMYALRRCGRRRR